MIAGENLRTCKYAGKKFVPAIVRDDLSNAEAAELAVLENAQRINISVIEEVHGYTRLMLARWQSDGMYEVGFYPPLDINEKPVHTLCEPVFH